ncbi:response regulator transcription factor [Jannaschia sp. R86511]|uniref:response regulator transcription factor n=1 Tax=Jannaschia sp. R86511 TaxID=3093853 RepID=UPI0036D2FA17
MTSDDGDRPRAVPARATVLLVEDDRALSEMLAGLLREEGYDVDVARDGQRGLHLGLSRAYDLLVVDRGLPVVEGLELLRRLRAKGVLAPVLVLTAQGTVRDRVDGLDAGAEDYLVKPFDVDELLARLRALLRRHADATDVLAAPGGTLDTRRRLVERADCSTVELSRTESDLLAVLARRPRQVFSRDELLERVFDAADTPGSVDTYVHYLRRKLGRDVVRTVRGVGYRLGSL